MRKLQSPEPLGSCSKEHIHRGRQWRCFEAEVSRWTRITPKYTESPHHGLRKVRRDLESQKQVNQNRDPSPCSERKEDRRLRQKTESWLDYPTNSPYYVKDVCSGIGDGALSPDRRCLDFSVNHWLNCTYSPNTPMKNTYLSDYFPERRNYKCIWNTPSFTSTQFKKRKKKEISSDEKD